MKIQCIKFDDFMGRAIKTIQNIIFQVTSPNLVVPDCTIGKKPWKLINVPLAVPSLNGLREKFSELTRAEPHLGLNPQACRSYIYNEIHLNSLQKMSVFGLLWQADVFF